MRIDRHDDVLVLTMTSGENRFNLDHLAEIEGALDEVEASDDRAAAVLTGEGKFFSNGLDLEWMGGAGPGEAQESVERSMRLMSRILTFPTGIVAAINGHCFAAGAMLALACDARVMRADRGYFCLPEVDIDMRFLEGMHRLITLRLTPETAHEAMLTGRRYGGEEALAVGIVEATASEVDVVGAAVARARAFAGKNPEVVAGMKADAYGEVVEALNRPLPS